MKIKRIEGYKDKRFNDTILYQHGAYLIDDLYPCGFLIISSYEAIIYFHDLSIIDEIIDDFRFYSKHITKFYDKHHHVIRVYDEIKLKKINIDALQPSQFFIDEEKIAAISKWIKTEEDIIIPTLENDDELIILDGHTRLYLAKKMGMKNIYIYEDESNEYIYHFVKEAKKREIHSIKDLQLVSHKEYIEKWHRYCDEYFNRVNDKYKAKEEPNY